MTEQPQVTCMNGHPWMPEWRACGVCGASSLVPDLPPSRPGPGPGVSTAWVVGGLVGYSIVLLLLVVSALAEENGADPAFAHVVVLGLAGLSSAALLLGVVAKGVALGIREARERP